jgi:hypothetical protein
MTSFSIWHPEERLPRVKGSKAHTLLKLQSLMTSEYPQRRMYFPPRPHNRNPSVMDAER